MAMLANSTIGFTIPAADVSRAKQFYFEKLGLTPVVELATQVVYMCAGSSFAVVPSESAGKAPIVL
jgi:catechol 2,3-dioxygenase-like lactoylglutathione lyase family enzyme